ncbi:hypothetical protein [Kitasatospora griseola]|uniref:hypothetical protein n=1 Tax=Kitasatospora griseola TaxID=2064 RepID=UPI00342E2395
MDRIDEQAAGMGYQGTVYRPNDDHGLRVNVFLACDHEHHTAPAAHRPRPDDDGSALASRHRQRLVAEPLVGHLLRHSTAEAQPREWGLHRQPACRTTGTPTDVRVPTVRLSEFLELTRFHQNGS